MKKNAKIIGVAVLVVLALLVGLGFQLFDRPSEATSPETQTSDEVPVKGMPTMVDLGANECIPCKMMVPIMEKVKKKYQGKAAVIFIDVWKENEPAKRFRIRAIPTQIFFDKEGKEVFRHEGFMGEADIDRIFRKMGVS